MPSPQTVVAFVDLVTSAGFVEAMERFYAKDARAQENCNPPRVGRQVLIEHEIATLASFTAIRARAVERPLIDGDRVIIHWHFEFDHSAGVTIHLDELADQRWSGEQLKAERFFYDPGQLIAQFAKEQPQGKSDLQSEARS